MTKKSKRIVLIGDNKDIREARDLKAAGYDVELAGSMEEAVSKLATGNYSGVIADPNIAGRYGGVAAFEDIELHSDRPRKSADWLQPIKQEILDQRDEESAERMRVEGALHKSEERLNAIIENLTEGLIVVDPKRQTMHWNRTALEMYEYTSGEAELNYLSELIEAFEVSTPDGRMVPFEQWPVSRLLRGEDMHDYELLVYHKKKNWQRIFSYNGTLIQDASGQPFIGILTIRDITDKKRAEKALRESEERLARAQESALVMTLYVSLDGRWLKIPRTFANFLGYDSEEELLGKPFKDFTHPDDFRADWSQVLQLLSGEIKSFEMEKRFLRKDGSITWGYINCSIVADEQGNPVHLLTYVRDINKQKILEQELVQTRAEAEQRAAEMESFFSSMADGAVLLDTNGNIVYINNAGRELLGLTADESANWQNYERYTPDREPIPFAETAMCRALRGELVRGMNERFVMPDGRELILYVSASPVRDNSGRVVAVTNVLRDDSARVQLERQRSELYEREHRIASMLQQALIPPDINEIGRGYKLAVKYQPAWNEAEIGGDFYDVFELGYDKIGILIGDVAGKGLQAAMSVAAARYTIRSLAYLDPIPAKVMTLANETLCRTKDSGPGILTAFFAVLDLNAGVLTYSSAGHEPPLMCSGGDMREMEVQGRMLGILGDYIYSQASHKMQPGDLIVMVTDGITEARCGKSLFGKDGIINYLSGRCSTPPSTIADGLLEAAREYAGGKLQDDVAIVVLKAESNI